LTGFTQQSDKSQGYQELGTIHSPFATEISHSCANSSFHAKESKQTNSDFIFECEQQSPIMPKCSVDPNPGSLEIIYEYLASHPSPETLLHEDSFTAPDPIYDIVIIGSHRIMGWDESFLDSDGFPKGWNGYWEISELRVLTGIASCLIEIMFGL
jgi:hypothetical protein